MSAEQARLSAEDYAYLLPDHWLLDSSKDSSIWTAMHHAYVARVVDIVVRSGSKRIIEVGCGDGWNCGKLLEQGLSVVGVDWSKNGIDHAKRMAPTGEFYCGDITDPEFARAFPEPFDAAVFVEVLEHIPPEHCVGALRSIRDLLRPGGLLVLTTPSVNYPNTNSSHYRHFTEQVLRDLVSEVGGITINKIEGYGDVPAEDAHYRLSRWVDNRHYTIHPIKRWLVKRHHKFVLDRPLDRCHGFIMTMTRDAT